MKKNRFKLICLSAFISTLSLVGQNEASKELDILIGLPLEKGHAKLLDMDFEIAHSSIFSSKQLWYNEAKKQCITFDFSKKEGNPIESIQPGNEKKCIRGVKAARRVWESYRDGGANVSSVAIEKEREALRQQGCEVSYWVDDVSPGKTMEVWYNESGQICKSIVWDTKTRSNIKVIDRDPKLGRNPAPVYNSINL